MNPHATTTTPVQPGPTLPSLPVLVGLYHVVPVGADRVLVANAGRTIALSGPGFADQVAPLLAALDGTTTAGEIEARFPDLAVEVLAALAAKGMLTDAAPNPDTSTGAPQLASLAFPGAGSPAQVAPRLAAATFAVAGCGPVGGHVAVLLAKAGAGRLLLADPVAVTGRDVSVSGVLKPDDEGCNRAAATARLCRAAGRSVAEVVSPEQLARPHDVAVVVIELGYDDWGGALGDACLKAGARYLVHSQDALQSSVGPLVSPGGQPCHRCLEARRSSHARRPTEARAYRAHRSQTSPGPDAYLAGHSSLVAGLVATEALRGALEATPVAEGAVVFLDLAVMVAHREVLHSVPGCPGCAMAPEQ